MNWMTLGMVTADSSGAFVLVESLGSGYGSIALSVLGRGEATHCIPLSRGVRTYSSPLPPGVVGAMPALGGGGRSPARTMLWLPRAAMAATFLSPLGTLHCP